MAENDRFPHSLYDSIAALGANFLSQGQYEKALIIFDGLIVLFPHELSAQLGYGEALLMTKQYSQAVDHFRSLQHQFGAQVPMLLGAAKALVMSGNLYEAKQVISPIIDGEITSSPIERSMAWSIFLAQGSPPSSINEN